MSWQRFPSVRRNFFVVLLAVLVVPAWAQRPDDDGRRGGPPGGGFGGRGGGPPGGGFGGRGGGPPGGDRSSSRGGGRGGFDPSQMLQRLDRNGNGMIDMDERDGPAGFIISRLERENPGLDTKRPIPLDKITEGFQQMRNSGSSRGGGSSSRGGSDDNENDALETELLVPGFGLPSELMPGPVLGFGPTAELFDVDIRPEDIQEAEERLRRYDRNRDGVLTSSEISSRWDGNPMDFDRNKDGKLTASELSIRYARRRQGEEEQQRNRDTRRRDDPRDDDREIPDPYDGRKSLRLGGGPSLDGLPGWFADRDANEDGQVMMNEYTDKWSDDLVAEFFRFDVNQDGTITAREASEAQADGASPDSEAPRREDRGSTMASRREEPREQRQATPAAPGELSEKYVSYASRIISRYDENKDNALVADEWKGMLIDPQPADGNRDGKITVEEYAGWLQNRQNK